MALIEKISNFLKKKASYSVVFLNSTHRRSIFLFSFLTTITAVFFLIMNFVEKKSYENEKNIKVIANSNEFLNFTNYIKSKISSPYVEVKYVIQNNDTI